MTGVTYRLKRIDNGVELAWPLGIRFLVLAMAAIVLAAMAVGRAFLPFPLVLSVLCSALSLYEEAWRFDTRAAAVEHRQGLSLFGTGPFAGARRRYPFTQVDELSVTRFAKGSPSHFPKAKVVELKRHQVTLYLFTTDGQRATIESRPSDHALDLVEDAREIGRVTGIRVTIT